MPSAAFDTLLGRCAVSWEGDALVGFSLPPALSEEGECPVWIRAVIQRVQKHLARDYQDFSDLPYDWQRVSAFQRAVYESALRVKAGQTQTYGELTLAARQPVTAARAVGTALGQNPWPLLVPCHRFIAADGRMTGFSAPGGIATKLRLLALEGTELFAE